jgi:hypothetical protein
MIYSGASLRGAEVIARTIRGSACGFIKPVGKGTLVHVGTWLGYDTEGHKPAYEALLKTSAALLRQAHTDNDNITVRERFTEDGRGLLFIGNYYNEEQKGKVFYTHPESGDDISIPFLTGDFLKGDDISMPPLYGILTPLCLELAEGLKLLHTTSDILNISRDDQCITITLYGDRDLGGEIVFEGSNSGQIRVSFVDGGYLKVTRTDERMVCEYSHPHMAELVLTLHLNDINHKEMQ